MHRLYFMSPDLRAARQLSDDLLLHRVDDRHIHILARRGTALGELHEASVLEKTDIRHGALVGLGLGAALGAAIGVIAVLFPPEGLRLELVTILLTSLTGSVLGAWVASMIGAQVPNSALRAFAREIEAGRLLVMVDLPRRRITEINTLVETRHPESRPAGHDPLTPVFP